jgi:hypothetical protein
MIHKSAQLVHLSFILIPPESVNSGSPNDALFDTEYGIMDLLAAGKILEKMRNNRVGWHIEELQTVAEENGVEWRRPGRGGSHVIFSAPGVREIVSVPARRPIKPIYIKQFLALIDASKE